MANNTTIMKMSESLTNDIDNAKLDELVQQAQSDTVTAKRLTRTIRTHEPVISYLLDGELPQFIFGLETKKKATIETSGDKIQLTPASGINPTGWVVISNIRLMVIMNTDEGDALVHIPFESIESVDLIDKYLFDVEFKWFSRGSTLTIDTNKRKYTIKLSNRKERYNNAVEYIKMPSVSAAEKSKDLPTVEEQYYIPDEEAAFICKECKTEVPPDAKKCPHCGYHPGGGGKGALWHGTALATSFSPIGWAMMAKGAADEVRSHRGVAEEATTQVEESSSQETEGPLEKLDKLDDLRDEGVITEEEFQEKKEELLDEI